MNASSFIGPVRCSRWTDHPEAQALLAEAVANPPRKQARIVRDLTDRIEFRYTGAIARKLRALHETAIDRAIEDVQAGRLTRTELLLVWDLTPTKAIDEAREAARASATVEHRRAA